MLDIDLEQEEPETEIEVLPCIYEALGADERYLAVIGGVGSGKTFGMGDLLVNYRFESQDNKILIGANTYSQLKDSTLDAIIERLEMYGFKEDEHWELQLDKKKFNFLGMQSKLRSFENDVNKTIAGMSLHKIMLDEYAFFGRPSQTGQYIHNKLIGRLRAPKTIRGNSINHQMAVFSSPNGYNHIYDTWIINRTHEHKLIKAKTQDNVYLPEGYFESLIAAYGGANAKLARQELFGEFVNLATDKPYSNYDSERCYRPQQRYKYDLRLPIDICHDFNIGVGKPMSAAVCQKKNRKTHVAKDFIVEGLRTKQILEEMADYGLFELKAHFRVFGDATGKRRDTRSHWSDIEIIEKFLANYRRKDGSPLSFQMCFTRRNPPIRTRHNLMNLLMLNARGESDLIIYKDASRTNKGFLRTEFKKGGNLIEDDSLAEQHVTTAIGYYECYLKLGNIKKTETYQL